MLAKKFRLPSGAASWRNRRPERKIDSPYFSLKIFPNNLDHNRFAAVISNRIDKRSARRHFWKRLILDYSKNFFGSKPARSVSGMDFLVFVQPTINQLTAKNFREEFDKALSTILN